MLRNQPAQTTLWAAGELPEPTRGHPTEAAYWRGSVASRAQTRAEQRQLGQFMTPPPIARYIARGMVRTLRRERELLGATLRVLDPAAGSGVLAAALMESLVAMPTRPARIELLLCEIDPAMQPLLQQCAAELADWCGHQGVQVATQIFVGDFLLSPLARSITTEVDAVIANPPYFKIARHDPRALAHAEGVHGQPNIYALFMSSCAAILRPGGAFGFITPRSWTNGEYFRATRRVLRRCLAVDALHLFDSREAHFEDDAVLQEALITWAAAGRTQEQVLVSSSHGVRDLETTQSARCAAADVLGAFADAPIVLPQSAQGMRNLERWPLRLADLEMKAVTGPVVGFRARTHLRSAANLSTVPMLWMPHVQRSRIEWPRGHRSEHIERSLPMEWMLLANEPLVVLRRFSPKEDQRRVTAAAYVGQLPGELIGLENHLNVIRGATRPLSGEVAQGLAAWLNSEIVDVHLRQRLGSTQVNAVELRSLPVPDLSVLGSLGRALGQHPTLEAIDRHVEALWLAGADANASARAA